MKKVKTKWKSLLCMLLCVNMVASTMLPGFVVSAGSTSQEPEEAVEVTKYVSATGNDATGDGTQAKPYATVSKAEAMLEANEGADTGRIIISGSVPFTTAEHKKMMTITGDGKTGTELDLSAGASNAIRIYGPTTMEQITLKTPKDYVNNGLIRTYTDEMIFGKEVVVSGPAHGYFRVGNPNWEAGKADGTGNTPTLTIDDISHSDSTKEVIVRVGTGDGQWMNGANITINGGTINQMNIHRPTQFSKDVNIVVNGGTIKDLSTTVNAIPGTYLFGKALQIVFNNGTSADGLKKDQFDKIKDNGGKWYMYGDATEGCSLSVTETAGTFKVNGEKVAVATLKSDTTKVYKGDPGETLVVPAGEYNVTYADKVLMEVTKYVSATGNDTTGDGSEAKPYATISKAEAMLEANEGADTGRIIISGSVAFDAAAHKKMITIEGDGAEGTMISLEKAVRIAGPTTIDKITFKTNTNGFSLVTEGQELVIGEEVKAVKGSSVVLTFLVGDHWRGVTSGRPTVKVNSNITLPTIIEVGSGYGNYTYPGADVIVNGGNLNQINLGKYNNTFTEDVNIVLSGISAIENGIYDQKGATTFKKALQIVLNDGLSAAVVKDSIKNANPAGGKWIMCGDKTGGSLSTTETAGSFMVNGDKIAVATLKTDETKVYKANPGENLVVPAGEYTVTYGEEGSGDTGSGDVNKNNTLYVSTKGNDTTGDGSEAKPYASISKAEAVLEANKTAETGKIVISGSVVFSAADHTKMMTITGDGQTGTELRLGEGGTVPAGICGPTTIEQIDLKPLNATFNAGLLETGQHELLFGKGVQVLRFNGFFRLGADKSAAGDATGTGSTPTLTVDSLAHNNLEFSSNNIRVGTNGDGSWMNGANLTINEGAVINEINIHRPTQFSKDVNIVVNGGTVDKLTTTVNRIPGTYLFDKALQIVFNNGARVSTFEKAAFDSIKDNGGKWYMFGGEGGSLSVTDTAGTFIVNGENIAVATLKSDMTKVYKANPGETLVVPAGEYYVTYGDNAPDIDEPEEILPDGPKMIKIEFTKNGKDKIFGQNVELEKGKQYTIAFQRKFLEGGMNTTTYLLLKAALGSGKYTTYRSTHLDGEKGFSMSEDEATSTVYYTFTHTEESGKYAVGFQTVKPATFYIANMSLYETADTAKKNLLPSAKTEEKNLDGWGTDWSQAGENQKFEFKEGGIVRYIATMQQYDAKVFAPREIAPTMIYIDADKNAKDQIFGQNVKLEKGKIYTISFRYKFKEGDIDSSVFLRVKDPLKSGKYRSYHSSNSTGANGFELKYNKKTCQAQYSFTHTGESGTYAIGFQFSGVTKMYLTDFTVYETADSTKKNILPSRGNEDTLLGWGSDWASAENTTTFQPKTKDGKVLYTVNAMPCDESIFKPDPELPPKMLYIENNGTYRQLVQRVKVVPGQKYRFSFCVASPIAVQGMVMHKGERVPIFNNMKPINEPDYEKDYYEVVYEFTLPNSFGGEAVDTGNVFVGIQFPAGSMGYVFNPKLWNVNDKEQENIYVNPGFNKGLDNWAFSWGAWFIPGLEGMGVNEFEKEGQFKLQVMKYDEEKFITYYDDSRFDDGEWWSVDDIVKEKAGTATVQGRFLTESGSPIDKAKMVLKSLKGSLECETDKDGKFHFGELHAGFYELYYVDDDGNMIQTSFAQNVKEGYIINVDVLASEVMADNNIPFVGIAVAGAVAGVSIAGGAFALMFRKKKRLVKKTESE